MPHLNYHIGINHVYFEIILNIPNIFPRPSRKFDKLAKAEHVSMHVIFEYKYENTNTIMVYAYTIRKPCAIF